MRIAAGQVLSAALGLGIASVAVSALLGDHGVGHLLRLRDERRALAQATFALLDGNARLHAEIRRLRTDELHLEGLARRQLGLVRPDETVYRFRRP